jgi:phosphate transport system substrate-binding protein
MLKRLMLLSVVCILATIAPATAATLINGAGATLPYPLYAKWFTEYARIDMDVKFTYQAIGSGEGIKLITSQAVDFGATDKYLSDDELKAAPGKLLHIPTVIGAVVITYNLPGIGSGIKISSEGLADIYLGKITRWNDPKLAGNNPGVKLPDRPIYVMHRSDSSGTSNIFTDYLSSSNKEWADKVGKGASVKWPVGFGGKGNEGVASLVKKTKYALGYVDLAHAKQNNLYYAYLMNREGLFVEPAIKSITAAAAEALMQMPADYRLSLVNQPGKDTYPIVGFTWLLVYEQQTDKIKGQKLVDFLMWSLNHGHKSAASLGYSPLPEIVVRKVENTMKHIK